MHNVDPWPPPQVNLRESRAVVDALLDSLPANWPNANTQLADSATGPALQVRTRARRLRGGRPRSERFASTPARLSLLLPHPHTTRARARALTLPCPRPRSW